MAGYAWVTLATNDAYSLGALVLAHSLRRVGTKYQLAVLVTPGVTETMREKLAAVFSLVQEVNVLDSKDEANLALLKRPELGITFTKLHCWRLTQYEKCVFVDADTLVVRNCDELFEREEFSAAPDVGWPDCFNSGVFVFKPSQETFASITAYAASKGSFDGGDQGLLNMYFSDWARNDISKHLPFIYNMCSTATYSYLPAFKQFGEDVRIIHFIGITKPWLQYFDTLTGIVQPPAGSAHLQPLLQLWWNIFCGSVHPQLSPVMATSTLAPIWHEFSPAPPEPFPKCSICHVTNDTTYTDVYEHIDHRPDFTEFKDPWENYRVEMQESECYCDFERSDVRNDTLFSNRSVPDHYIEAENKYSNNFGNKKPYEEFHSFPCNEDIRSCDDYKTFTNENNRLGSGNTENHFQQPIQQSQVHGSARENHFHNEHRIEHYAVAHSHKEQSQNFNQTPDVRQVRVEHGPHRQHSCKPHQLPEHSEQHRETQHCEQHSTNMQNHLHDNLQCIRHYTPCHEQQTHQRRYSSEQTNYEHNKVSVNTIFHPSIEHRVICDNQTVRYSTESKKDTITEHRNTKTCETTPVPPPFIEPHIVATRSDHVTERLDSTNAGLAGALAQMTLGEPRSAEQIALEEHMRKQSWEQGQIDYMGRDSFDNIWKKICETLALAPPRLPSPPKETGKPAETDTETTAETVASVEPTDEVDKSTTKATSSLTEEQSLITDVPAEKISVEERATDIIPTKDIEIEPSKLPKKEEQTTNEKQISPAMAKDEQTVEIAQCPEKPLALEQTESLVESVETEIRTEEIMKDLSSISSLPTELKSEVVSAETTQSLPEIVPDFAASARIETPSTETSDSNVLDTKNAKPEQTTNETIVADPEMVKETIESSVGDERHAEMLSSASEVLTVSPVPIQIAESVLQAEPTMEESISDSRVVAQEVLFSTVTPVQEFDGISENPRGAVMLNGSASVSETVKQEVAGIPKEETVKELVEAPATEVEIPSSILVVEQPLSQVESPQALLLEERTKSQADAPQSLLLEKQKSQSEVEEKTILEAKETVAPQETEIAKGTEGKVAGAKEPEHMLEESKKSMDIVESPKEPERVLEESKETKSIVEDTNAPENVLDQIKSPETIEAAVPSKSESVEVESPVRPNRSKELSIPATPTVTEATPPTSPPITPQETETPEKTVKKSLKKSEKSSESEPTETDDNGEKKPTKKVIKKVVKKTKSKEEADDGAEGSKQKKTVKIARKPKSTLGADASVPETPPPGTSGAPVPPKRKAKATSKSVAKKSDAE